MKILKAFSVLLIFALLTVFTQVGGLAYLASVALRGVIHRKTGQKIPGYALKPVVFLAFYSLISFAIVPVLAGLFGRVPLPLFESGNNVRPLNALTFLLNRNYVRPEMREALYETAKKMDAAYPGTVVNYLDANFPFIDRFPLLPHLSHNDGKKLDLSFCYSENGSPSDDAPSFIGYGICEEPLGTEKSTPDMCARKGYRQYSLLKAIVPQGNKAAFSFDKEKNKALLNLLAGQPTIGKIFIEPHLKTRLGLTSDKIRFHGCQAVRHDDHIHAQLR